MGRFQTFKEHLSNCPLLQDVLNKFVRINQGQIQGNIIANWHYLPLTQRRVTRASW